MSDILTVQDRQKLATIVEDVYDFKLGPEGRWQFLTRAGLKRFLPALNLSSPNRVFAGSLIGLLEPFGMLPERPAYHALGALISLILDQPDTPREDAALLAAYQVKYELVADPDYLNKLRTDYGLDVTPVRQADPAARPPARNPDVAQEPAFTAVEVDEGELEVVVNSEDNFLDVDLLAGAIYSAQAVGRVETPAGNGTGFLVGPELLLTNQHVLTSQSILASSKVRFNYQADADGVATKGDEVAIDPAFYLSSPSTELDYALVRLKKAPLGDRALQPGEEDLPYMELLRRGRHRGYLLIAPGHIVARQRVNVIQHPGGNPQKVVLTQNYVATDMSETRVHYLADTQPGSSGSPVFNRRWEVVALHHSGGSHPPQKMSESLQKALKGQFKYNEGIPMQAIFPHIQRYLPRR